MIDGIKWKISAYFFLGKIKADPCTAVFVYWQ
jgi:hypothetical protein